MQTASWVIVSRGDRAIAIFETFSRRVADAVNTRAYRVVPILEWLQEINQRIKAGERG